MLTFQTRKQQPQEPVEVLQPVTGRRQMVVDHCLHCRCPCRYQQVGLDGKCAVVQLGSFFLRCYSPAYLESVGFLLRQNIKHCGGLAPMPHTAYALVRCSSGDLAFPLQLFIF